MKLITVIVLISSLCFISSCGNNSKLNRDIKKREIFGQKDAPLTPNNY